MNIDTKSYFWIFDVLLQYWTDVDRTMWARPILLFEILFVAFGAATEQTSSEMLFHKNRIAVTLSERKPFVKIDQNGSPVGLDVLIIQNFAHRFKLSVEYFIINDSLNSIFSNEQHYIALPTRTILRWDDKLWSNL